MASYSIASNEIGTYAHALTASTVDTVTVHRTAPTAGGRSYKDQVEVWADGTAAVYFTTDGSTPTVAGQNGYEIPAGAPAVRDVEVDASSDTVLKLISAGTPKYSVTAPANAA